MFALPIFTASHPATIVGVRVLNFCVRDGREPARCQWQSQRGRSVCSGRQAARRQPQLNVGHRKRKQVDPQSLIK